MSPQCFDVYVPLHGFKWDGSKHAFGPQIEIVKFDERPDLRGQDSMLAEDERRSLDRVTHWLHFKWTPNAARCHSETANLFVLALWLAKPTKTQICFRFLIDQEGTQGNHTVFRLLDRFICVSEAMQDSFIDHDLVEAGSYFCALETICATEGRLSNAALLTLTACWAYRWVAPVIVFAAALETLLTYSTGRGLTKRLAVAYACLLSDQVPVRDAAFLEFNELYETRSEIVHGRMGNVTAAERLPMVVRFHTLVRNLWSVILANPNLIAILEDSDAVREAHFISISKGYSAPQTPQRNDPPPK